jgi:hypothetical protein
MTYKIVRIYHPDLKTMSRVMKKGLTEAQALKHCANPKTRKDGVWFDTFDREK